MGERANDKVGEPVLKETGVPEGTPTIARPLIGRVRSIQTKKYRHVAVVIRLEYQVAKPVRCCLSDDHRLDAHHAPVKKIHAVLWLRPPFYQAASYNFSTAPTNFEQLSVVLLVS